MRRCRKLAHLFRQIERRLGRLRAIVGNVQPQPRRRIEADITYVAIDLLNTWANFVRAYYLSCALGARTIGGQIAVAAVAFQTVDAAIGFAVQQWRPNAAPNAQGRWARRQEPTWHDKNVLLTLSDRGGLSNDATIQGALSLPADALIHLPVVRNFFAHRNQGTYRAVMSVSAQYSIFNVEHPSGVLLANPIRRPQSLILEWIDEIETVASTLCA